MTLKGKLIGLGLGPGDPELITVKGLRAMQNADIIFYPATEITEDGCVSFSEKILNQLEIETPKQPLLIPMRGANRDRYYQEAFKTIQKEYKKGKTVVVVAEGDSLFYSTFGYLLKLAQQHNMACELIPGIPAFIATGSKAARPFVEGNQDCKVLAKPNSFQEITKELKGNSCLVVMKMSVLKGWYEYLKDTSRSFFYIEKVGTEQEFSTTNVDDLVHRNIPYFSLIIFYK